ncbi:unnamed protein product [Auanema sp. JU1783]|nr:unnamed protein product [Auanema sp. JU1783]
MSRSSLRFLFLCLIVSICLLIVLDINILSYSNYAIWVLYDSAKYYLFAELDIDLIESLKVRDVILEPHLISCQNLTFLIVVQVACSDKLSREWFRSKVGSQKAKYGFDLMFSVGRSLSEHGNTLIRYENEQFGDILQTDFIDSYHNLTLKQLSHMRYIDSKCRNVGMILKVDDDIVFNIPRISLFIESIKLMKSLDLKFWRNSSSSSEIFCCMFHESPISHSASGKWAVTRRFNQRYWPDFCSGSGYFISTQAITDILRNVHYFDYLWLDDVFLTGFVAARAKVKLVNIMPNCYLSPESPELLKSENYLLSMCCLVTSETSSKELQTLNVVCASNMNNSKRLEKYRNELEHHLEKVNRNLDEEIQQMRERLKKTKEQCIEKRKLKKELTGKIITLERKVEEKDNFLLENRQIVKATDSSVVGNDEEIHLKLKNYKKKNSELRTEIVSKTNTVSELMNEARKENILQETRSLRSTLEKIREEVEDSTRKKTAQDSAIERLRADISLAEESQSLIENLLEKEIDRRINQTSDTVDLKEKVEVFEKENVQIQDEFSKLLNNLKERDMRITRLESEAEEKKKRIEKLNKMNDEYLEELRKSIERTKSVLQQENEEIQKCEQFMEIEANTLKKLEKKYKDLREKKCLKQESDCSEVESDSDFERNLKDITRKHGNIAHKLLEKKKRISSSLSTRHFLAGSRGRDSIAIPNMKKAFLNLKREQKALEFKARSLMEKKNLLNSKVENLLKDNERMTADLRKAEEVKENLLKEIGSLEALILDGPNENKDKTENERKVELVKEAIRKHLVQNDQLRQKSENLKKDLSALQTKIRMLGNVNVEEAERLREEERASLRRLRNSYGDLMKKAKKRERELELCIIQRESTVNRAQSVVHLVTTVKAERENEIKGIRKRVSDKRQILERTLDGTL